MLGIFKKKKNGNRTNMQLIKVKRNKNNFCCFKGQFVSIDINENSDNYYFSAYDYDNNKYMIISNRISDKYYELCQKYDYGLIYDFDNEFLTIAIICKKGYLKAFDIELDKQLDNGTAFILDNNNLIDNNEVVGNIMRTTKENITLNSLDHNKLICFIEK